MANGVKITGFKEFSKKAASLPKKLIQEADGIVTDAGLLWEERAKSAAPVDQGQLRGEITTKKLGEMKVEVVSQAPHSAYIEWGTKTKVSVPSELQGYASQFKGGGGEDAKKFIYAWMERVGIPEKLQWITFISIITKGINPHPFFFIQKPIVEKQLKGDLSTLINVER